MSAKTASPAPSRACPEAARRAACPKVFAKLLIWGYLNKVRSTRGLEREASRNLELIWLLGTLRPDHSSISRFLAQSAIDTAHDLIVAVEVTTGNTNHGRSARNKVGCHTLSSPASDRPSTRAAIPNRPSATTPQGTVKHVLAVVGMEAS